VKKTSRSTNSPPKSAAAARAAGANSELRPSEPLPEPRSRVGRLVLSWRSVPILVLLTAVLAYTSLVSDSITFDETSHLTVGMSYWKTGDYRYTPDHPPLAKLWAALPLLFMHAQWPSEAEPSWWDSVDSFEFGRIFLFRLNDGQTLLDAGRCMIVLLLLGTCVLVYLLARRLWANATAALLALFLACLSPTLLAHGRLVTTDMPIAFCTILCFYTFALLAERLTWPRIAAAVFALMLASVTKMSWPLIVPGLVAMALVVLLRRRPWPTSLRWAARPAGAGEITTRARRSAALAGIALLVCVFVPLGVWTAFGWRYSMFAPVPANAPPDARVRYDAARRKLDGDRARTVLATVRSQSPTSPRAAGRAGALPTLIRFCDEHQLLPEAYLLGLAQTIEFTSNRRAYLMGEYSGTGWRSFFPIAFLVKTPLATQALLVAALVALARRKARPPDRALFAGLAVFVVLYATNLISSNLNIGHRHLLPLYPLLFVLAGGAAAWATHRVGQWLIAGALVWLLAANLYIYPDYLAYFNEAAGGPRNGHKWLADSSLDWGQELIRLADYCRKYPGEDVKLAYFGSAPPRSYLECTSLQSHHPFEPRAQLTPGIYAIGATQLVGVYFPYVHDSSWPLPGRPVVREPEAIDGPQQIRRLVALQRQGGNEAQAQKIRDSLLQLRTWLLMNQLRHRAPDARPGWAMFVYHLDEQKLKELTTVPGE
jgi:hypothetical protein